MFMRRTSYKTLYRNPCAFQNNCLTAQRFSLLIISSWLQVLEMNSEVGRLIFDTTSVTRVRLIFLNFWIRSMRKRRQTICKWTKLLRGRYPTLFAIIPTDVYVNSTILFIVFFRSEYYNIVDDFLAPSNTCHSCRV